MSAPSGFADVQAAAQQIGLDLLGIAPILDTDGLPPTLQSLALLGPHSVDFWPQFSASTEAKDAKPDPIDRYSQRLVSDMATRFGGMAVFPFGQTPPLPFITWALRSGECHVSEVNLLIHNRAGLWVSFRGALALERPAPKANQQQSPCADCLDKPCHSACPVSALTQATYDLPTCHAHLDQPQGAGCMSAGCAVRRACPVSQAYGRLEEQSAHHMRYFHP